MQLARVDRNSDLRMLCDMLSLPQEILLHNWIAHGWQRARFVTIQSFECGLYQIIDMGKGLQRRGTGDSWTTSRTKNNSSKKLQQQETRAANEGEAYGHAACEGLGLAWALRIRSLHGLPLSPLRNPGTVAVAAARPAWCAASIARIVANSRKRAPT